VALKEKKNILNIKSYSSHTRSGVFSTRYFEGDDAFVGETIIFSLYFIKNASSFENKFVSVDNTDKCGDDE
jgi:hypothetical protein